ncbi:hypothetical protein VTN00DRAFT_3243 [Thermoascus crustaceus]|uniref:uncharacterized protein n=1 Tax=Thermoascus crustaceus TaxID=5088 RepID=UPI00374294AF
MRFSTAISSLLLVAAASATAIPYTNETHILESRILGPDRPRDKVPVNRRLSPKQLLRQIDGQMPPHQKHRPAVRQGHPVRIHLVRQRNLYAMDRWKALQGHRGLRPPR